MTTSMAAPDTTVTCSNTCVHERRQAAAFRNDLASNPSRFCQQRRDLSLVLHDRCNVRCDQAPAVEIGPRGT